jgi:8-oxo-dGTP diphosphatase
MAEQKRTRSSVAGIAINNHRILTAKRRGGGDLGGKWEFPGGKVRDGEDDRTALVREYGEELSVPIEVRSFIGEASFEHGGIDFTLRAYQITLLSNDFSLREHSEYRWVTAEELEELDFAGSDKLLFPKLQALLGVSP